MKTLNELLKNRVSLSRNKDDEIKRHARSIAKIELEIRENENFISAYFEKGKNGGIANQLVSVWSREGKDNARVVTLDKFKDILLDGNMQDVINIRENISYWYNHGFGDGHARRIVRGYGEDYAVCLARVSFSDEVYDNKYQLTDEDIIALVEWVNDEIERAENCE